MLRNLWLVLIATAFCGWTTSAYGQARLLAPVPVDAPIPSSAEPDPASAPSRGNDTVGGATRLEARLGAPVPVDAPKSVPLDHASSQPDCRAGLYGGASVYFLRPYINNNTALTATTGIGTPATNETETDFDWNYHIAPAFWLGWNHCSGVGIRGRYFSFDHESEPTNAALSAAGANTTTIAPPAGVSPLFGQPTRGFQSPGILLQDQRGADALNVLSDLRIQTVDAEATYTGNWGRVAIVVGAGGRYLQLDQNYRATLVNIVDPTTQEVSILGVGHDFQGGGPTLAGQVSWKIAPGMLVFGSARGAYLVGTSHHFAAFSETIVDPRNGNQNNLAIDQSRRQVTLPTMDLECGLEIARLVGHSRVFVRGAVVNQTYFGAGSASTRDGNLSLFGAQVTVGLEY